MPVPEKGPTETLYEIVRKARPVRRQEPAPPSKNENPLPLTTDTRPVVGLRRYPQVPEVGLATVPQLGDVTTVML
jgi:hypothetical protein